MTDHTQFQFNPADLTRPRPFGISAYMRIKNEEQFVRLAIESHLPFYDEIIAVYNDCTDDTESILLDLQRQHPSKIKVFHYLPRVHAIGTPQHAERAGHDDNTHSIANYYNFALSQCTYSIATKLDADHLAIPHKLRLAIEKIRSEFATNKDKIFLFSGLNVMRNQDGELGMTATPQPFSGNGDIFYHRIDARSFFVNHEKVEHFNHGYRWGVPAEYIGILYIHLKHLKHGVIKPAESYMPFNQFKSRANINRITRKLKLTRRIRLALHSNKIYFQLMHKLTKKYPSIRTMRQINLYQYLQTIDFENDAIKPLQNLTKNIGDRLLL